MTTSPIVTVNIGRMINDAPMSDAQWSLFQQEIEMLLAETVGKVTFSLTGDCESHWQDQSEQSASFSVVNATTTDLAPDSVHYLTEQPLTLLRLGLGNLATRYGQEAIALTVGTSELVSTSNEVDTLADSPYWDEVQREADHRFD